MTNKKATSTKTTSKVAPKKKYTTEKPVGIDPLKLDEALYKAEEDFDKALCSFMLLGETLRSAKEDLVLNGDKVELGVLERRLTKEVRSWFKEWGWDIGKDDMTITFKDVPIEVKFIKKVVDPYANPDVIHYKVAQFQIPNPWRDAVDTVVEDLGGIMAVIPAKETK